MITNTKKFKLKSNMPSSSTPKRNSETFLAKSKQNFSIHIVNKT